jgi:hypothetical protein
MDMYIEVPTRGNRKKPLMHNLPRVSSPINGIVIGDERTIQDIIA